MQDRFLFRGKQLGNGKWIEGFLGPYNRSGPTFGQWYIVVDEPENGWRYSANIDIKTIGQCTGLKDKNGKLIFEGDIIWFSYDEIKYADRAECKKKGYSGELGVIQWHDEYPAFDFAPQMHDFDVNGLSTINSDANYWYEVIGNIHDNPELLEVS